MINSNFHTHSLFCDGADTPEEMIEKALELNFNYLGFSGHSYLYCDREFTMNSVTEPQYKATINELKDKYKGKINILCGIEQDYFSEKPNGYDYIIGSVHNVLKNGLFLSVDASAEVMYYNLKNYYNGDFDNFAENYFALVADVVNKTDCDIIGHFDLILKYSEKIGVGETDRYLKAAKSAIDALIPFNRLFEINTGAIARGARSIPYPTPAVLKMIKEKGGKIIFSSDCHNKNHLNYYFKEAEELARKIGFTNYYILTECGRKEIKL